MWTAAKRTPCHGSRPDPSPDSSQPSVPSGEGEGSSGKAPARGGEVGGDSYRIDRPYAVTLASTLALPFSRGGEISTLSPLSLAAVLASMVAWRWAREKASIADLALATTT